MNNIQKHFTTIKTNTVVIKGVNDNEVLDIIDLMKNYKSEIRFIEYMDVGESNNWDIDKVVPSKIIREKISHKYNLASIETSPTSTAKKWLLKNTNASVGLISSITEPFCSDCNRARLSVDGKLFTCLFASEGYDIKNIIRSSNYEEIFLEYFVKLWSERTDQYSELRFTQKNDIPKVEMSYIGG